jgi:tape measure domain-containing protein
MSTAIGKVAYIATWDATQLVKGVMTSRQQFSAQKKIVESMKSPLDRYSSGLENLKAIVEKYPDVARHQLKVEKQLEAQYLNEEKAIRSLTATEAKRLKALNIGPANLTAVATKSPVDMNRQTGLAEQNRIRRLTVNADQEAAIGRRALQDRLRLFKAEKSAEEKRTRDLQLQFNKRMRLEESASRARAKLLNVTRVNAMSAGPATSGGGRMSGMLGMAGRALPMMGGMAAGYAALGIAKQAISVHADIERNTAAMEVFTGSASKAVRMMNQMRNLSAESGVGFGAMQNAVSTMMSFGVSVDRVLPAMRQMAEITRGDTERLGSLSLAFAQSAAAGKLMGQDLLQMVNAGFNPLQEMSRTTGKSISQLRVEMSSGRISFDKVANAFKSATGEGGKFNGMMAKIGETSAGSLSLSD